MKGHQITLLGTGLIGDFYAQTLHSQRGRDRVRVVYSRSEERGAAFGERWGIEEHTTDLAAAIRHPETDVVVIGVPNFMHEEAVAAAAKAGKAVLCTKPLGRNADEAKRMLAAVEDAGVFGGYLEDLVYTPKTLKALGAVRNGAIGEVTWVRSRETHPGPHSAWFWDGRLTGGGAIVDLGCHCIEIIRSYVGKGNRPVEVLCTTDTLVHPIADEDNAIALIRFESGATGQFEVSWTFRGGMDLRDEVAGTHGTVWTNHFLRTGFEMFTAGGGGGYVAEKSEASAGWLFPVGDEVSELGYVDMFEDMFDAMDEDRAPRETFYDGYVVNAVMDAAYRSAREHGWVPVELDWRGGSTPRIASRPEMLDGMVVIKREILPDGREKLILKDPKTGDFADRVLASTGGSEGR
jgi:predicted dehydrogenase